MSDKAPSIHLLRGLGGNALSQGMDDFEHVIQSRYPHARVKIWDWNEWHAVVTDMRRQPVGTPFVLIGYSMGANEVTGIAETGIPIVLLVAMDPTLWDSMSPLLPSVRRAVLFHDVNPLNIVGHAELTAGKGFDPRRLIVHTTWDLHSEIDKDIAIRNIILAELATALA